MSKYTKYRYLPYYGEIRYALLYLKDKGYKVWLENVNDGRSYDGLVFDGTHFVKIKQAECGSGFYPIYLFIPDDPKYGYGICCGPHYEGRERIEPIEIIDARNQGMAYADEHKLHLYCAPVKQEDKDLGSVEGVFWKYNNPERYYPL